MWNSDPFFCKETSSFFYFSYFLSSFWNYLACSSVWRYLSSKFLLLSLSRSTWCIWELEMNSIREDYFSCLVNSEIWYSISSSTSLIFFLSSCLVARLGSSLLTLLIVSPMSLEPLDPFLCKLLWVWSFVPTNGLILILLFDLISKCYWFFISVIMVGDFCL